MLPLLCLLPPLTAGYDGPPASASMQGMPGPREPCEVIGQPQGDSVLNMPFPPPFVFHSKRLSSQRLQQSLMLCSWRFGVLASDFGRKAAFSLLTGAEKLPITFPASFFPFQVISQLNACCFFLNFLIIKQIFVSSYQKLKCYKSGSESCNGQS